MANVNIKFNNKDYLLSCDDGQEESLKKLTKFLDKKYTELKDKLGNIGENKLLLITTIQLIDEYFDLKQKVTNQKKKLDEIIPDGISVVLIDLLSRASKLLNVENKSAYIVRPDGYIAARWKNTTPEKIIKEFYKLIFKKEMSHDRK